ncbi:MAG: UTP--glucose-1-phosphate uridylyltransferase [Spirochaetia bacterium]|nr:UTP--glucose-1-phosphate uridylyltransferase [Spirochaetia bacterium]
MSFQRIETAIRARMKMKNMHDAVTDEFLRRVRLVHEGYKGKIPWNEIGDLNAADYARLEELSRAPDEKKLLSELAVIKLNGGLGTTMGLEKAKSLIPVKEGKTFLDIIASQITKLRKRHNVAVPLFSMNSFNTQADTLAAPGIREINNAAGLPPDFVQNMVPRIHAETLLPTGDGTSGFDWCPPGHGDIFISLEITGILDRLIADGFKVLFISNGDNLGATVDTRILNHFMENGLEFLMEATPKTKADLKGGVLYRRLDASGRQGHIELLETAQVDDAHIQDFQDVKRFQYFSINNLWVSLRALKARIGSGLPLSVIVNPKKAGDVPVLQLETAMGSAVGRFEKTRVVIVPRERFAPVKNCADLLVRRSDAYTLREEDAALVRTRPDAPEPVVVLDDAHYKKLPDFESLFPKVPSLIDAEEFTVKGRWLFDRGIKIKGKVFISTDKTDPLPVSRIDKEVLSSEMIRF